MKYFIHQEKYYVEMDEIFNPCAKNISSMWMKSFIYMTKTSLKIFLIA